MGIYGIQGFKVLPLEGRPVDATEQRAVGEIIEAAIVLDHITRGAEVVVEVGRQIPSGLTPAEAHGQWRESYFPNVQTPVALPRQAFDGTTPAGLVHVLVSAVEKRTPGMGSHFGFEGYLLSLLVSLNERAIWDARGEQAT
jgi:hypothetical protein